MSKTLGLSGVSPVCFRLNVYRNSPASRKANDTTSRIPRGRCTCRAARHYRNLIKLRDNICCRSPAYSSPPGRVHPPTRDSVIANSVLPLRILKFRAPAAARYPGERCVVLLSVHLALCCWSATSTFSSALRQSYCIFWYRFAKMC